MTENIEKQVIEIIATDRIDMPISSMSGKLKRTKPKLAKALDLKAGESYDGKRVYARVEKSDELKSRGMSEGIALFEKKYPRYGAILREMIDEQRASSETHLYFGINEGCRLTSEDYLGVMTNLGFSESIAGRLYPELVEISTNLARKRDEERSILIG